jgi:sugar-specific transcriptional regulator TrmB
MDSLTSLTSLGLSEPEAQVYLSLLRLGQSPASRIAKDTGIKRTTIYPILRNLTAKGFVSLFFKHDERHYLAQRPQKISSYYKKRLQTFEDIIPQLETLDKKQAQVLGLRFIETTAELEKFYTSVVTSYPGKTYYIIGDSKSWEGIDPNFLIQYRKDRAKAKINVKLLLSANSRDHSPTDPTLRREVKFLPAKYKFKSTIDIYPDQILIVSPELSALAVVIAIPAMTDVFRSMFEMLWDSTGIKK